MTTEQNIGADAKEELSFIADQAISNIQAWKSHLLCSLNQDQARLDVIDELDESSVLLIEDWAMKFLPCKYRENRHDWFGKRGYSATADDDVCSCIPIMQPRQQHCVSDHGRYHR